MRLKGLDTLKKLNDLIGSVVNMKKEKFGFQNSNAFLTSLVLKTA
jgi:hypothetical protein